MRIRRHVRWVLPLAAFLVPVLAGLHDLYWWRVRASYRKTGSHSCGLARGYAREFELKHGRRPDMDELRAWALRQFTADLERMKFDPGIPQWRDKRGRAFPVERKPAPVPAVP